MLTTTPYLRIRRPSPTAAEFIVSTLPPLTLPLRLSLYAIYVSRFLLSFTILLFLYATWANISNHDTNPHNSSPTPSDASNSTTSSFLIPDQFLSRILFTPPGLLATYLAEKHNPTYICISLPICLALLYMLTCRSHTTESLLVLRGLGIQMSSSKRNILTGVATTRFIPTDKIQDVLINEAFHGFGARYYLVVVVDGEPDVVVVFPKLLPRANVVEQVWRGVRECLYERGVGGGLNGKS